MLLGGELQGDLLPAPKHLSKREKKKKKESMLKNMLLHQDLKLPHISLFHKHGKIPPKHARRFVRKEKKQQASSLGLVISQNSYKILHHRGQPNCLEL